jgi:hypothetical protein
MGQAVFALGNHSLDINSIETLAKDISVNFQANVNYGYYHQYYWDIDGNEIEPSYKHIQFGYISYPDAKETLLLSDEFYQIKQLLSKHENDILKLPCFKNSKAQEPEIEAAKKGVKYAIRDYSEGFEYGYLYNSTFIDFFNEFNLKWWNFCRGFMANDGSWSVTLKDINDFRNKVKSLFDKIGATEAVYVGDQGKLAFLTYEYLDWNEIIRHIQTTYIDKTLNISEFMKQKKPLPNDQFPLAFYDDFADLR